MLYASISCQEKLGSCLWEMEVQSTELNSTAIQEEQMK